MLILHYTIHDTLSNVPTTQVPILFFLEKFHSHDYKIHWIGYIIIGLLYSNYVVRLLDHQCYAVSPAFHL